MPCVPRRAAPAQVVPGLELLLQKRGQQTLPHAGRIRNQPDAEWPGKKGRITPTTGTLGTVLQMRRSAVLCAMKGFAVAGIGIGSAGFPRSCRQDAGVPIEPVNYSPNVTWREFATDSRR